MKKVSVLKQLGLIPFIGFLAYMQSALAEPVDTSAAPATPAPQAVVPQPQPTPPQPATTEAAKPEKVDCSMHIPATTKAIEQPLVVQWATKAAEQAFEMDYQSLDSQLKQLKACFTQQGWDSFSDALEKSGNLKAIRAEKLTVSSMMDGEASISVLEPNQWKLTFPLSVVYQNEKEKLNQSLEVTLLVGRKTDGDLGIIQLVAMPKQTQKNATQPTSTPATGNENNAAPHEKGVAQ